MKINKIIALLLSVIFIFSVNVTGFAEDADDAVFEPAVYNELISMLSSLGVIDSNYYAIDSSLYVTRGEFAEAAARVVGLNPISNFSAEFIDVPSSHNNAPYIYAMKKAGYMTGVSVDTFLPDEYISLEQAVCVMVKLAGYGDVALATGGYPTGYLTIASRNGMLDNINAVMSVSLTKGILLDLINNVILCDVLVPESYGSSVSYITREGVNVLSYYHKIYTGEGVVEADAVYTMNSERASQDEIIIAGVRYKKPANLSLVNVFGRKVNFFFKVNNNTRTLLFAKVGEVNEITFMVDPNLNFSRSNGAYTYETTTKELVYKIGYDYSVVYNMNELSPIDPAKMLPATGTVTLIDNNIDGIYEIVIVDEFTNFIVGSFSEKTDKFIDLVDPSRVIDLAEYESYQLLDTSSNQITKYDIFKNDVMELYESADGKTFTGVVIRTGVPKIIDSFDGHYVYSGDEKYLVSGDFRADISSLYLGGEYTVYLNSKGELVYWVRGDDLLYGYVTDVRPLSTNAFSSSVSVKLFTTSSQLIIYPLADKVTNYAPSGITVNVSHLLESEYTTIFPETNYRELIAYKLNSQGEIAVVYHPMVITDLDTFKNPPEYPFYRIDYHNEKIYEASNSKGVVKANSLNNILLLKQNGPIMFVPPITSEVNDASLRIYNGIYSAFYTAGYVAYGSPTFTGANETFGSYMIGNTYPFVSLMTYHKDLVSSPNINANQYDFLITNIRYIYDQDTYKNKIIIEGKENGSNVTLELPDDTLLKRESFINVKYGSSAPVINENKTKIEVGDCIDYVTDATGTPITIALLFDSKNKQSIMTSGNRSAACGQITYVGDGGVEVTHADGKVSFLDLSSGTKRIYEVDRSRNYDAKPQDFEVGDTIYYTGWGTGIATIVGYKNN